MDFWYIYLIVFGIFLFVGGIVALCLLGSNSSRTNNSRSFQESVNKNVVQYLNKENITISKIYYLNDYLSWNQADSCKKLVFVNKANKIIYFINYETRKIIKVNFNEFLNYEIYENGGAITTGGTLYGYTTSIFGASTNNVARELKLIIRLNRFENSQIVYNIVGNTFLNTGLGKNTEAYKKCMASLQEFISFLEVVKQNNLTATQEKNIIDLNP